MEKAIPQILRVIIVIGILSRPVPLAAVVLGFLSL